MNKHSILIIYVYHVLLLCLFDKSFVHANERMPFVMQTFVSGKGQNIAPVIHEGLKGFQKNVENGAEYLNIDGIRHVKLSPKSQIKFSRKVLPKKLYKVFFRYSFESQAEFDYNSTHPGLHGWVSIRDKNGNTINACKIYKKNKTTTSLHYSTSIYSTDRAKSIYFSIEYNGTKGHAFISDLQIQAVQVSDQDNLRMIRPGHKTDGETYVEVRTPTINPSVEANMLTNPDKLRTADIKIYKSQSSMLWQENKDQPIIFYRDDPDKLFFYSMPKQNETGKTIKVSLTPDEVAVTTLAVRIKSDLPALRLGQIILKDKSGRPFPGNIEWSIIKYHPRRVDYYGRGQTWHWVADYYDKAVEGVKAKADITHVFRLKMTSVSDSEPESYIGNIQIYSGEEVLGEIPIEIVIRAFSLVEVTDKTRGIYPDSSRWSSFTDEQVLNELSDFKSHGINTLVIPSGRPLVNDNLIVGWRLDKRTERNLSLIRQMKMDGPFVVWFGWLENWLTDHFNLQASDIENDPAQWPRKIKSAYRKCLYLFKNEFERQGWGNVLFHAVDEPGYWKEGSPEQFIWKYRVAREVGLDTYSTSSYLPEDPLGVNLTHHCYVKNVIVDANRTAIIRQKTEDAGQQFWLYGVGCYSGQVGNIVRNRYLSGFLFFKSKANGLMVWTFQRPIGNPFDDFYESKHGQACITYPDPNNPGENLDTPHWEGIRQGWIDYRYAATLADLAKTSEDAQADLDRILGVMPWNGDPFVGDQVTNKKCDIWREEIAKAIEKHMTTIGE